MNTRILLVEDDDALAKLMTEYLSQHGYSVAHVVDGLAAETTLFAGTYEVAIVDLMLPGQDGLALCRRIRPHYAGPVLVLTASDDDFDQVAALEAGADDYVVKPVEPRVLLARLRALLRRVREPQARAPAHWVLGALRIDRTSRRVSLGADEISLTTAEFDLLCVLAELAGTIVDRDTLRQRLRGLPYDGLDKAIDLRVSRLRRALGDDAAQPRYIKTVRGRGYLLAPPEPAS